MSTEREAEAKWPWAYEPIQYDIQRRQFIDALIARVVENPGWWGSPIGELATAIMEDRKGRTA